MDSYERQVRLRLQAPDGVVATLVRSAFAFSEAASNTPNGYFIPFAVAAASRGTPSEAHQPTPPGTKKRKAGPGYDTTWHLKHWNIAPELIASVEDRASWKLVITQAKDLPDGVRDRLVSAGLLETARDGAGTWAARAHRLLFESGEAGREIARAFAPAHRILREWLLAHLLQRLMPSSNGAAAVQSTLDQLLGRSLYGAYAPDFVNFFLNSTKILQFSYVALRRSGRDHSSAWACSFARLFDYHEGLVWAHQLAAKTLFNSPTQRRLARGQAAVDADMVREISERSCAEWPWIDDSGHRLFAATPLEKHAAIWAVLSGLAVARREEGRLPRAGRAFQGWRYFDQIVHAAALFRLVAVELTRPEDELPWLDEAQSSADAIAAFDELTRRMAPIVKATLAEDTGALRKALDASGVAPASAPSIAARANTRIQNFVDWLEPEVAQLSKSSAEEKPTRPRPFQQARKEAS